MNISKKTIIFLFLTCNFFMLETKKLTPVNIFSSIAQIKEYTETYHQYPNIDNTSWNLPDYTSFYKKNEPTWWDKILGFLRIKKPLWSAHKFKKLLQNITHYRENNGLTGRFVQRISPDPGAKFVVWGSLFGAFHSIERCLDYLVKKGVINKHLQVLDKNTYLVFEGNVINLSPYILETLTLILKLMEINSNQVIYLRGSHEEKEAWLKFGLKTELEIKAKQISNEKVPLKKLVNRFFRTLPLALYITAQEEDKTYAVRLSYPGKDYKELDESSFAPLFQEIYEKTATFNLKKAFKQKKANLQVKAIIQSPYKKPIPLEGLDVTPSKKINIFVIFSAPTKTFRAKHKFFYDAFSIIDIKETFKDWTITLYNQDLRENLGIHKAKTYNLSTGTIISKDTIKLHKKIKGLETKLKQCELDLKQKITDKKPEKEIPKTIKTTKPKKIKSDKMIILGTTLDLSGPFAQLGEKIKKGLLEGLDAQNIKLEILDDEGISKKIAANIKQLTTKKKAPFILSPLVMAAPDLANTISQDKKTLCIFPIPSCPKKNTRIINFGPTYEAIAKFALKYAMQKEHAKKFAFFYQKEIMGNTIDKLVKNLAKDTYVTAPYNIKTIRLEDKAKKIRDFRPSILFIWGTPATAINIIKQIKPMNMTDTIIIGHNIGTKEFKKFLVKNDLIRQYVGIECIPNPYKSNLKIMKEYRKKIGEQDRNIFSAQAYIYAQIAEDIINKSQNNLSQENIIKIAKNYKNYNFKGLELNFSPQNHTLSENIWLDTKNVWKKTTLTKQKIAQDLKDKPSRSVRKKNIEIGTTMDLKGAVRGVSLRTLKAIKVVFYLTNKAGGIDKKKIKIIAENDNYKPKIARENIEKLLKKDIDIILIPVGGPTTQGYLDLIEKGEVLVLFPSTGAPELRDPDMRYMIHFRPSYKDIYAAAIKYIKEEEKEAVKKIAFVYQDDAASGTAVEHAINKNKLDKKSYIKVPYSRGQKSFKEQAKKIEEFEPDMIAFWCQTLVMTKIIKKIGAPNLKNKLLLTTEMGATAVLAYMEKIGLSQNFINTENIPSPATSQIEIMKEYRKYLKLPDAFLAETYVATNFFIHALKNIPKPITKEKIITFMENTKNYNFKGFELNFDPKTRQLSNNIWIYKSGKQVAKVSTNIEPTPQKPSPTAT